MKKYIHVVGAVIENENKDILCALRGPEMTLAGYWEFPGGKIEKGESNEEALKREVHEELGCIIEVHQPVEDTTYEYDKFIVRLETFMAKVISGNPVISEHAEIRWVALEELPSLNWAPADIPAVERVLAQCKKEFTSN